jgi:hypothetical protein
MISNIGNPMAINQRGISLQFSHKGPRGHSIAIFQKNQGENTKQISPFSKHKIPNQLTNIS